MTSAIARLDQAAQLTDLLRQVGERSAWLHALPSDSLLALLDNFAARLGEDPRTARIEGGTFLVFWLRRRNLERLLDRNLAPGGRAALDRFIDVSGGMLRAQPAGVVGHWVAGNVPTLAVFSWILSLLVKNTAVVRVSEQTLEATSLLLEVFGSSRVADVSGEQVLQTVRFVHFPRDNEQCHRALSLGVDTKIIWGSAQAVQAVTALPRQDHCNELVFGPKYSLGVIDRASIETRASDVARAFVRDILVFDQRACSSPQMIFVERSSLESEQIVEIFATQLQRACQAAPKTEIDSFTASRIYTTRALWGLATDRTFRASRGADWTVCFDTDVSLKEAVQSRTLFLTQVNDAMAIIPLLSPRIQTIGLAFTDRQRAVAFADAATRRGVSRCVRPGLMNVYDLPWDGKLPLSELVRWVALQV